MGRAFTRAAIGALVVAMASVTGVIATAAAADPGAACITAAQARFVGYWNSDEPVTLGASLKGEGDAALCGDVVLNVSVYALPTTWNGQGWNPTAVPQTLISHGEDLVFPKGATAGTALTTALPSVPCVDFQIDLYRGAKLDRVTYPNGHGSGYLTGGLVDVDEKSPRCAPPTAPPATMPPAPSTTASTTESTSESTTASVTSATSVTSETNSASTTSTTQGSIAPGTSETEGTTATTAPTTSTTTVAAATTAGPTTALTRPTPVVAGLALTGASDGLVSMTVAGVVLLLGGVVAMRLVATRRQRARHR